MSTDSCEAIAFAKSMKLQRIKNSHSEELVKEEQVKHEVAQENTHAEEERSDRLAQDNENAKSQAQPSELNAGQQRANRLASKKLEMSPSEKLIRKAKKSLFTMENVMKSIETYKNQETSSERNVYMSSFLQTFKLPRGQQSQQSRPLASSTSQPKIRELNSMCQLTQTRHDRSISRSRDAGLALRFKRLH